MLLVVMATNWTFDKYCIHNDANVRDIAISLKKKEVLHCNINVELLHKDLALFHNLRSDDYHLIMQELGEFNFKINVILNGLEKHTNISINYKLSFIDNF